MFMCIYVVTLTHTCTHQGLPPAQERIIRRVTGDQCSLTVTVTVMVTVIGTATVMVTVTVTIMATVTLMAKRNLFRDIHMYTYQHVVGIFLLKYSDTPPAAERSLL